VLKAIGEAAVVPLETASASAEVEARIEVAAGLPKLVPFGEIVTTAEARMEIAERRFKAADDGNADTGEDTEVLSLDGLERNNNELIVDRVKVAVEDERVEVELDIVFVSVNKATAEDTKATLSRFTPSLVPGVAVERQVNAELADKSRDDATDEDVDAEIAELPASTCKSAEKAFAQDAAEDEANEASEGAKFNVD